MANLKLKNPAGGSLNLVSADGASDLTVTFPATTGTAMVSGNMPAFSAYPTAGVSCASGTDTKVLFQTEDFDTNNNFASSRFTPTVAGYYLVIGMARFGPITATLTIGSIFVNGSVYSRGSGASCSSSYTYNQCSAIVYLNGSTDYVEFYAYQNSGSAQTTDYYTAYKFTGSLLRAA